MHVVHMASALTMSILAWKHRCSYAQVQLCTSAEQTDASQSLSPHDCINTW
jgi:hypothetical protein